ncbi:hypothetical protein C8Q75DRAFT_807740 [Abortiporus biennis]|nr:hypothetical protein C8Q75DRAFT_807740 [Abortiporus biennis]
MAVPAEMTTLDISGRYHMNDGLSDDTDEILRLQGLGWLLRKALALSHLYMKVKHFKDQNGIERIEIDQTLSGGIPGTTEIHPLDWKDACHEDHIFGAVYNKARRVHLEDEIKSPFLRAGWTDDVEKFGAINTMAVSDPSKGGKKWVAEQVWGFALINGERRHTRHVAFVGPNGEVVNAKLVYDYQGPL